MFWFPVWILEPNLTKIENIKKELSEETWYKSNEIEHIWETIVWNYDNTKIVLYKANNCELWKQELEDWEVIEVFTCSLTSVNGAYTKNTKWLKISK